MTPLELTLIVAAAAVVVLAILLYGIPYLIRKHLPIQTYITLSEEALNFIKDTIEPLLPAVDQKALDMIVKYAELAVQYAEQLYVSGQLPANQRKQAAIKFVINAAKAAGITLTATEMAFVDAVVEAAVYLLPETGKTIAVVPTPPISSIVASGTGTNSVIPINPDKNTF